MRDSIGSMGKGAWALAVLVGTMLLLARALACSGSPFTAGSDAGPHEAGSADANDGGALGACSTMNRQDCLNCCRDAAAFTLEQVYQLVWGCVCEAGQCTDSAECASSACGALPSPDGAVGPFPQCTQCLLP